MIRAEVDTALGQLVRAGSGPTLYLLLDSEDRVVESNRQTQELVGPHLLGARFGDLLASFERGLQASELARAGALRKINVLTFTGLPQTYECGFAAVTGGTVVVGGLAPCDEERMRRDLLQLNQELAARERGLQKAKADLTRLGRLKDQFLGMAAHDLRAPITAISFFAQFLVEDLGGQLSAEHAGHLDSILGATDLMKRQVDGFLDAALLEAGQLHLQTRPASLDEVVRSALAMLAPVARRRSVSLAARGCPDLPLLPLDQTKMTQVVINLVNNAIEHSRAGAEVLVSTRREGAEAVLAVQDWGAGVPEELRSSLFSPYVHGADGRTGSERSIGLGLAITRLIALAHGGQVSVASQLGVGSTFTVRLPFAAAPAEARPAAG